MLASTGELVAEAAAAKHGVGAFNVITLEHAEAIAHGAEDAGRTAILQISQNAVRYHGALAAIAAATLAVARASTVRLAVHLDHATDAALVREAVELGVSSVMFDASALDYDENVRATAAVVAGCHAAGVWVEAELGEVGGKDGVHAPGARTDPSEARAYVEATGVDALAVAVGSSHAMLTRDAALDFELIGRLREAVPVPLVLHGSSGVPDDGLRRAVASGIVKVNIGTQLNRVFTAAVRSHEAIDPRKYLGPARDAVAAEVARLITLLA
jgi:fructose-bisphosphate aldolase class II